MALSSNVLPPFAGNDFRDDARVNTKLLGECALANVRRSSQVANLSHLIRGQFPCVGPTLTTSIFAYRVPDIDAVIASKQVRGIDAGWRVAPMANKVARRDRANERLIRKPMGSEALPVPHKAPVPRQRRGPGPKPAIIGSPQIHIFPEPRQCRVVSPIVCRRCRCSHGPIVPNYGSAP